MSFTVYKSSAGSGKTYTLVKEYLKLVLNTPENDKFRHILAITFTNKAANEMKERVLDALVELSSLKEGDFESSALLHNLAQELPISDKKIAEKAKAVLRAILHNYADFGICTIDKFVHRIIRVFAFDLHLPLNFEVELNKDELLNQAIDQLISKVGEEEGLTRVLLSFSKEKADDEKNWNIEKDIFKFANDLFQENNAAFIDKLKQFSLDDFFKIKTEIYKQTKSFEAQLKAIGEEGWGLIHASNIDPAAFAGGANGIAKYFEYLRALKKDKFEPSKTVVKHVLNDNWYASKANDIDKSQIDGIKDRLNQLFGSAQLILENELSEYRQNCLFLENIYALAVLNELDKVITSIKSEKHILHISEFNKRIAEIVMEEPAPFIYERLGEKYQHYLVDEFQDTSELQWQNLLPLVENSLAYNHFNMIVGDGKQAIYRWRGGEVDQFSMLPLLPERFNNPIVKQREETLVRNFVPKVLNKNYRSKKAIVDFNNRFFQLLKDGLAEGYKGIYDSHEQEVVKSGEGYVLVKCLENLNKEENQIENFQYISSYIEESLQDGYNYNDITVLVRNNKEGFVVAEHLISNGVEVVTNDSLLITHSFLIKGLVAYFHYLIDPKSTQHKVALLKYFSFAFDKDLLIHEDLKLYLSDENRWNSLLDQLEIDPKRETLLELPLYDLIVASVEDLKIDYNNPFVVAFLEFAFQQGNKRMMGLVDFLDEWELKKSKVSIPMTEGRNAVNILTIHKSKGLQFPVTIVPFVNWNVDARDKKHWVHVEREGLPELQTALISHKKELSESVYEQQYQEEQSKLLLDNINLLYVAFTRPQDRLYVITNTGGAKNNVSSLCVNALKEFKEWDDQLKVASLGVKSDKIQSASKHSEVVYLPKTKRSDWRGKLEVSYEYQKQGTDGMLTQVEYGSLIHEVLANIDVGVEVSLRRIVSQNDLNLATKEKLEKDIRKLLDDKSIMDLILPNNPSVEVLNERELLMQDGTLLRPDRVLVEGKRATILDYKTGEKLKKYEQQLNQYANALEQMGYEQIEKYIVYTEALVIEKV